MFFLNSVQRNPEDWCLPEGTKIDLKEKTFILPQHSDRSLCLQAPYSLHKSEIDLFIQITTTKYFF